MKGLDLVVDAVSGTLGPKGRNVFLMDATLPIITNDGVTVANKIVLADPKEDSGAWCVRNITSKQNEDVGDGTTTVAVLYQAIIQECLQRPENPMEIKDSLKAAGEKILKTLASKSVKITKEDVEKVALIASENKEIAKIITEIINKIGEKAVINVEDSKTFATEYEITDGYEAPVGFMSPHFINDKKSGRAVYTDIPVLVTEKKISNIVDIEPLFNIFKENNISSCVIVCNDIDDSMLGMLVMNKNMGRFNSLVIRGNGFVLEDIEGATGAIMVSDSKGVTFQNITLNCLGKARKVVCDANKCLFIGNSEASKNYAEILDTKADNEPNQYVRKRIKDRVAKLRGGIAIIKVGAPTDLERDYLKFKAEDSIKSVQAALEEGIVEGAGLALWRIAQEMKPKTAGEEILKKALTSPFRKIVENTGKDYTEIVTNMPEGKGYNAKTDTYADMFAEGIIDPSKVERCALENAISSASTLITTFCLISEKDDKKV